MTDAFEKFTRPRADEEIHQGMEVPVTFSIDPSDRMPVQIAPDNQDRPPPLAVDTFVCMEDKRSFVIRNSDGSVFASFEPKEVSRLPNGQYFVELQAIQLKQPTVGTDDDTRRKLADHLLTAGSERAAWGPATHTEWWVRDVIRVEPIRPACQHYVRVQTDISADRERRFLTRSCAAQRSESGEYYSVGDASIFACSMRLPRHLESEQILEDFDALSMQRSIDRVKAGSFDVDAELAAEASGSLGVLGTK